MATLLNVSKAESNLQNEIPDTIESMINQLFIKEDNIEDNSSSSERDIKLEDFNEDDFDLQTEDTDTQHSFFFRPKGEIKSQTMKGNNTFFQKNSSDFMPQRIPNKKVYKTTCINTYNTDNNQQLPIDSYNNNLWSNQSEFPKQLNTQSVLPCINGNSNKGTLKQNGHKKRSNHHKKTCDVNVILQKELGNCFVNNQQSHIQGIHNYQLDMDTLIYEIESMLNNSNCMSYQLSQAFMSKFLQIVKTQTGSRILQNYLTKTSLPVLNNIYNLISSYLHILLFDPYANYFCLKLFYCLGPNERISYLQHISPYILNFSINKVATYPIQCIIANLITHQEKEIVIETINPNIDKISYDIYGTHVIEKILICLEPTYTKVIVKYILDNFYALSSHVNGLCIAKRILLLSTQTGLYRNELIYILNTLCVSLIQNPYGNYALQIVIEQWDENSILSVISPLMSHIAELSIMKYSSNVIERCLEKVPLFLCQFIKETCGTPGIIGQLIKNSYGNYVVQTALRISSNELKVMLINSIEENLNVLEEKKLINKWKSILATNIFECVNQHSRNYMNN